MTDLDSNIRYVFTMVDNVSTTASTISDSAVEAQNALHQVEAQEETVKAAAEQTTQAFTKQEAQFLKNAAVLMTLQSSVSAITSGLINLGVVTGEDAEQLQNLTYGFQLLTGMVQGLQALQAISESLRASETALALVETYRSVMQSPWKAALVGVAAGATVGAVASLLASSGTSSSSSTTNITIENTASNVTTGNMISATISGGKVL